MEALAELRFDRAAAEEPGLQRADPRSGRDRGAHQDESRREHGGACHSSCQCSLLRTAMDGPEGEQAPGLLGSARFSGSEKGADVPVDVKSEKLTRLVDESVEIEQLGTGFTFTEGPIWHPRERVPPVQRHARRHPAQVDARRHRRRGHEPEQQVQRHDLRRRPQPARLRAHDELGRPGTARRDARDTRHALPGQGAEQPERHHRPLERRDLLQRPHLRPLARLRDRARPGPRLPGRLPPRSGRRRSGAARRRLRRAERALLLAGRVAAVHQRHAERADPRLRRGARRHDRKRTRCSRRRSATATSPRAGSSTG